MYYTYHAEKPAVHVVSGGHLWVNDQCFALLSMTCEIMNKLLARFRDTSYHSSDDAPGTGYVRLLLAGNSSVSLVCDLSPLLIPLPTRSLFLPSYQQDEEVWDDRAILKVGSRKFLGLERGAEDLKIPKLNG